MNRTYTKRKPYGKRGPYKPRQKYTPRRAAAKKAKTSCKKTSPKSAENKSRAGKKAEKKPSFRFAHREYCIIRNAITLAMNKLLLKPKYHCPAQKNRRLRFDKVGYLECRTYMLEHPAACKLGRWKPHELEKILPSRTSHYRILKELGWDKQERTRSRKHYPKRRNDPKMSR